MTLMAPDAAAESLDPRDPLLRLRTFFDDGSVELLHERDTSGVLADFFIGAHAAVEELPLLTRDSRRYRHFFPSVVLITPESET